MPRKRKSKKCVNCVHLYTDHGRHEACWFAGKVKDPTKKTCKKFKEGVSFVPRLRGKLSKLVKFDPEKFASWTFYTEDSQCLILSWDPKEWCWKSQLVGISKKGGLVTKNFSPTTELAAFFGRAEINGVGENNIYTSNSFEDPDEFDEDQCIVNKPREVRLYPVRPNKRKSDA